jgi:hypothetical protein
LARLSGTADDEFVLGEEYETDDSQAADRVEVLFAQDDLPDPFFSMTDETEEESEPADIAAPEEAAGTDALASLAELAASLPASPSAQALRQVSELAASAKQEGSIRPQQSIVLDMLESSAAMLAKAPQQRGDFSAIVRKLASGLAKADEPAALAATVSCYTAWQRQFFDQLLNGKNAPAARQEEENQPEFIAKIRQELHDEFRQLRQELLEEFGKKA